jgi:hypothetical protein
LAQSPTAHSRPLDVDQLDARLREVASSENNTLSQARPRTAIQRSRSRTSTDPIEREASRKKIVAEIEACGREIEMEAYSDLVKDGGRPLYPIDRHDEISRNCEEYSELLQPWLGYFGNTGAFWREKSGWHPFEIFQKQRWRWQ